MRYPIVIILIVCFSCSSSRNELEERPSSWFGEWKAQWNMSRSAYPDMDNVAFTMNGKFIFSDDSLTVVVYGYPGCIFGNDTLSHTQSWKLGGDSVLYQINDVNTPGIEYQIKAFEGSKISLQLLDDISVELFRKE